jgi:hypothetical protein
MGTAIAATNCTWVAIYSLKIFKLFKERDAALVPLHVLRAGGINVTITSEDSVVHCCSYFLLVVMVIVAAAVDAVV